MLAFAASANAQTADLSLRLPAALSRFPPYPDVAGTAGASVGSPYPSSVNPAALAWKTEPGLNQLTSLQGTTVRFDHDMDIRVTGLSASFITEAWGVFQPTVLDIRNNGSTNETFLQLSGTSWQLQWARRLAETVALGLSLSQTPLDSTLGAAGDPFAVGRSTTTSGAFGLLWEPAERLLVGIRADYARAPGTTEAFGVHFTDTTVQRTVRPGLSYRYADDSHVFLDYQRVSLTNATGDLIVNRLYAGVEQRVLEWLFLRAGLLHDSATGNSPAFGIGLYPAKNFAIDIAYQRSMFPELKPELGNSQSFGISASVSF